VTLPLIVARERNSQLASLDLRELRTADDAAEVSDRIIATGALEVARDRALGVVLQAKDALPLLPDEQRSALELVADGVVERYS
jgi:geranylgeranyl pyrophosphate synthase